MSNSAKVRNLKERSETLDGIQRNLYGYFGFYRGYVDDTRDPDFMGRVRVRVPAIHGMESPKESLPWAEVQSWGGGAADCGSYIQPLIGTRVLVIFEQGHPQLPLVISSARAEPTQPLSIVMPKFTEVVTSPVGREVPNELQGGDDTKQLWFKTWKGHTIEVEEQDGAEYLRIIDRAGNVAEFSCPVEQSGDIRRYRGNAVDGGAFDPSEMSGATHIRLKDISGQEIKMKVDPSNPEIVIATTGVIRLGGAVAQQTVALAQLLYSALLRVITGIRGHRHVDGDGKNTTTSIPPIPPFDPVSTWEASGVYGQTKNTGPVEDES